MSMSQEEIEALMNGLDEPAEAPVAEPEPVEESSDAAEMSANDIENLIAETQSVNEEPEAPADNSENNIDDLLAQIDGVSDDAPVVEEPVVEESSTAKEVDTSDIDAMLAGIDGVSDDVSTPDTQEKELIGREWTNDKVDQGIFPSPVEPDTKVVGQLSQVANDSEEKAGQIFDVLSFILDENNDIQKNLKSMDTFVTEQTKLMATLTQKFPNVAVFKDQLAVAQSLTSAASESNSKIDAENMKIFEAMELMQFNDINRQKIERVMSVIKKLATYLNNLFEDTENYKDVAVAKHIHGDSTNGVVDDDDLESLIAEFNK